ncbi:MAG: hypothetical protein ABIS03_04810 [Gemmatimonadaceae bacterium]
MVKPLRVIFPGRAFTYLSVMKRRLIAAFAAGACMAVVSTPRAMLAQVWNDTLSRSLVERATERRALQIADTALASYRATAHGYLTFLAQVGEGFPEPPKIVKADELALQIYWMAPNLSKQLIAGRRDTLLLPTDINYHRDHLGIVQNNFPNIIRLGDGDEVRDVPHPLSAEGLTQYDFAIRDSLRIRLGPRELDVYEVRVRPKNDREPRAVGAVYIDRGSGDVVRMAFSFTRAALRDKELEDVSVVLENGLIDGRFWLPRRQEIEIRRSGTWLDYPARGIIRGRWEVCCYQVNVAIPPALFAGPEIALAPPGTPNPLPFVGRVLDSLPSDVRAITDEDVAKVQEEARALVRAQALARTRSTALSARSVSDFLRVNRVEGLALGVGVTRRLGEGFSATARTRYGISDERLKARAEIAYRRASGAAVTITGNDDYSDPGLVPETSRVISSIAAQEFGTDYSDPFGTRGVALDFRTQPYSGWTVTVGGAIERQRPLDVNASPATGRYQPTIDASRLRERRLVVGFDRPTRMTVLGVEAQIHVDAWLLQVTQPGGSYRTMPRLAARGNFERPLGEGRFVARTLAGWVGGSEPLPPQRLIYLGGPTSAPGYQFHQFAGRAGASQRFEGQFPVAFVPLPLGRYGRTPATITLAPFVNVAWIDRNRNVRGAQPAGPGDREGFHPSIGIGVLTVFDLIRFDVARGLRDGRTIFSVDVARELHSVL